MSGKASGAVWDMDLPRPQKYVLVALADHADHAGGNIHPGIERIAWKTGYDERQVRRIVRELEATGILVPEAYGQGGRGRFTKYRINFAAAIPLPDLEIKGKRGARLPLSKEKNPDISESKTRTFSTENPDILACPLTLTVIEPSEETPPPPPSTSSTQQQPTYESTLDGAMPRLLALFGAIHKQFTADWLRRTLVEAESIVGPLPRDKLGRGLDLTADQMRRGIEAGTVRSPRGLCRRLIIDYLSEQRDGDQNRQAGESADAPHQQRLPAD